MRLEVGAHLHQLSSQARSMVTLKKFSLAAWGFCRLLCRSCGVKAVKREMVSIVESLKESVAIGALLSARYV